MHVVSCPATLRCTLPNPHHILNSIAYASSFFLADFGTRISVLPRGQDSRLPAARALLLSEQRILNSLGRNPKMRFYFHGP